jgi:2-polyprenyl-3-methyl-5-hydroxy-6-metoxy-1,4-benzoquinol methylase
MNYKYKFNKKGIADFLKSWFKIDYKYPNNTKIFQRYYKNYIVNFSKRMQFLYAYQTEGIMQYISTHENQKILEIGCGCGTESLYMAYKGGAEVVGIDIQSSRLNVAKERLEICQSQFGDEGRCSFFLESILDHKISHDGYDIIWMEQAFHHLEPRDRVVKKIASLLKPGGRVFISEANALNIFVQLLLLKRRGFRTIKTYTDKNGKILQYGDERVLTFTALSNILKVNGISPVSVDYFRCFPSGKIFDKFLHIEKKVPKIFKFLFTHYNYVGVKDK